MEGDNRKGAPSLNASISTVEDNVRLIRGLSVSDTNSSSTHVSDSVARPPWYTGELLRGPPAEQTAGGYPFQGWSSHTSNMKYPDLTPTFPGNFFGGTDHQQLPHGWSPVEEAPGKVHASGYGISTNLPQPLQHPFTAGATFQNQGIAAQHFDLREAPVPRDPLLSKPTTNSGTWNGSRVDAKASSDGTQRGSFSGKEEGRRLLELLSGGPLEPSVKQQDTQQVPQGMPPQPPIRSDSPLTPPGGIPSSHMPVASSRPWMYPQGGFLFPAQGFLQPQGPAQAPQQGVGYNAPGAAFGPWNGPLPPPQIIAPRTHQSPLLSPQRSPELPENAPLSSHEPASKHSLQPLNPQQAAQNVGAPAPGGRQGAVPLPGPNPQRNPGSKGQQVGRGRVQGNPQRQGERGQGQSQGRGRGRGGRLHEGSQRGRTGQQHQEGRVGAPAEMRSPLSESPSPGGSGGEAVRQAGYSALEQTTGHRGAAMAKEAGGGESSDAGTRQHSEEASRKEPAAPQNMPVRVGPSPSRPLPVSALRPRPERRGFRADVPHMNARLSSIVQQLVPTAEETERQSRFFSALEKMVARRWPNARLHLYGSCANGFGVRRSDVDVCLALQEENVVKAEAVTRMAEILKEESMVDVQALSHARVPIVKFKDPQSGLSCDICVNNLLAVANTKLLRDYARIDSRLRPMVFLVKHWAKQRQVNEAYRGTLSSYAYVIMCIHFLQQRKPPILPCLQQMPHTHRQMIGDANCGYFDQVSSLAAFGERNKETVADLLVAFFDYWAYRHDYNRSVISIRVGGYLSKEFKDWTKRVGSERHLICIEDPFEISHDLGRVVDRYSIKVIKEEFLRAAHIIQGEQDPCQSLFMPFVREDNV